MAKSNKYTFNYAAVSVVGNVRTENQDSAYAGPNMLLVADGMGGHAGGDTASTLVVQNFMELDNVAAAKGISKSRLQPTDAYTALEQATVAAHTAITQAVNQNNNLSGMGTTMTCILRADNTLVTAHLGDSRAYIFHEKTLTQITTDHTFVQHLVDTGKITAEDAMIHPQRNVVMRVLGDFDEVEMVPDFSFREIVKGDRWMLCSDGLCGYITDDLIQVVLETTINPTECAHKLVDLALDAGSTDNVTAIVADVVEIGKDGIDSKLRLSAQIVGAAKLHLDTNTPILQNVFENNTPQNETTPDSSSSDPETPPQKDTEITAEQASETTSETSSKPNNEPNTEQNINNVSKKRNPFFFWKKDKPTNE